MLGFSRCIARLRGQVPVIEHIQLPGQTEAEVQAQVNLEIKTVQELIDLDIFDQRVIAVAALPFFSDLIKSL